MKKKKPNDYFRSSRNPIAKKKYSDYKESNQKTTSEKKKKKKKNLLFVASKAFTNHFAFKSASFFDG